MHLEYFPADINITAVFGVCFGLYMIVNIEHVVRSSVAFVKNVL